MPLPAMRYTDFEPEAGVPSIIRIRLHIGINPNAGLAI